MRSLSADAVPRVRRAPPPIRLPVAPASAAAASVVAHALSSRRNRQRRTALMILGVDDGDNHEECERLLAATAAGNVAIARAAFERVVRAVLAVVQPGGHEREPFQLSREALAVLQQASEERCVGAFQRAHVVARSRRLSTRDATTKVPEVDERDLRLGEWLARRDDVRRHCARAKSNATGEGAAYFAGNDEDDDDDDAQEIAYYRRARALGGGGPKAADRCKVRPSDRQAIDALRGQSRPASADDEEEEDDRGGGEGYDADADDEL